MFKYKEKNGTCNIQSVVHCRKFSTKQNVSCSEFRQLTYMWSYI